MRQKRGKFAIVKEKMLRIRQLILLVGDIILLYGALALALFVRRPQTFSAEYFGQHFWPFTIIFIIWITLFYIAGLYDLRRFRGSIAFARFFSITLAIAFAVAIAAFYLIPYFGVAPKTNLFLFLVFFALLDFGFRYLYNRYLKASAERQTFLIIGRSPTAKALIEHLNRHPQIGYRLVQLEEESAAEELRRYLKSPNPPQGIILPSHISAENKLNKIIYAALSKEFWVTTAAAFYENIFRRVPLSELNEAWFVKNIARRDLYSKIKHFCEPAFALLMLIVLSPLFLLISILIKLTSRGPVIYKQKRVGERGNIFTLYKFRTMKRDAERDGPQWARERDRRVTPFGRFLRYSHLDELPQLWNILRGELSFVGPRPERPEFVERLHKEISFYDIRHVVRPGVTGWAQVLYRYGASVEDAKNKLEFDIFYLKNRSVFLDLAVLLKTLKHLFTS